MAIKPWGDTETYSILRKRHHAGVLRPPNFQNAVARLQADVFGNSGFRALTISDSTIFGRLALMQTHNINLADAAILAAYLRYQRARPTGRDPCVLIASDKRLIRASEAEGLRALNPEMLAPGDVPAFLAAP